MSDNQFKYEVAFSFLQQDEPLVMQVNDLLQDRMMTFFYPERQREIAGTDGEEMFNKVFGGEARMVAVFYRKGWGETQWTRIEQTAIKNRGAEEGYDFAKFIPLDEPPEVPKWLPKTQIWIGLKRFGIEAAAAVLEARVQELGGQSHEETVEERAARLARAIAFDELRKKFQWEEGARASQAEFEALVARLETLAKSVVQAAKINFAVTRRGRSAYLTGLGRALGISWNMPYGNSLNDAHLDVVLFSHPPAGPSQFQFEQPRRVRSMRLVFDLLPSEVGGWILADAHRGSFSTEHLASFLMKFYMEHGRRE